MPRGASLSLIVLPISAKGKPKRVKLPILVVTAVILFLLAGSIGLGRAIYVGGSYVVGFFGGLNEQYKNAQLRRVLDFLTRRVEVLSQTVDRFGDTEDVVRLRMGLSPIGSDIRRAGVGGPPSVEELAIAGLTDEVLLRADSILQTLGSMRRRVRLQNITSSSLKRHINDRAAQWAQLPSLWPAVGRVTSVFGYRYHPVVGERMFHEGIDIASEEWTPVFSSADGVVQFVGRQNDYGKTVILDHPTSGYQTVYAHLVHAVVAEGQLVSRRQLIGYIGSSGRTTGTHLHYEVRYRGKIIDPMHTIMPRDVIVE